MNNKALEALRDIAKVLVNIFGGKEVAREVGNELADKIDLIKQTLQQPTDSEVEEAYSNEDLDILRHFGNLITVQIFGSNKLYDYESENWLANVLFDVSQEMNQIQSVEELWGYLLRKLPDIIGCDRISISQKYKFMSFPLTFYLIFYTFIPQISSAYSRIVRSVENFPIPVTLSIDLRHQSCLSR